MIKYLILSLSFMIVSLNIFSQDIYYTKSGLVEFSSTTPLENIDAVNKQVVSFLKTESGDINFGILIKSFKFKNALMEEHFNENYIESDKYPKAKFKGKIINIEDIDFKKDGVYTAKIKGKITIHGVTKEISTTAEISIKDKVVKANSTIMLKPEDFDIEIPGIVREKIAKEMTVKILINYELYKK